MVLHGPAGASDPFPSLLCDRGLPCDRSSCRMLAPIYQTGRQKPGHLVFVRQRYQVGKIRPCYPGLFLQFSSSGSASCCLIPKLLLSSVPSLITKGLHPLCNTCCDTLFLPEIHSAEVLIEPVGDYSVGHYYNDRVVHRSDPDRDIFQGSGNEPHVAVEGVIR